MTAKGILIFMTDINPRVPIYEGKGITILYEDRLCMSASECNRADGGLFMRGRNPWCTPDCMSPEAAAEIVRRCPSGALSYIIKDGGPQEAPEQRNVAVVSNNGPLYFKGDLKIDGAEKGMEGTKCRAALCRCGRSAQKPFCDDAHEKPLFDDSGAVGIKGPGYEGEGGKLNVGKIPDGPLMVCGKLTIVAGNGREAWKGTDVELCRCGHSANKPFCDYTHVEKDFKAK